MSTGAAVTLSFRSGKGASKTLRPAAISLWRAFEETEPHVEHRRARFWSRNNPPDPVQNDCRFLS
jgi:hypothetical protein